MTTPTSASKRSRSERRGGPQSLLCWMFAVVLLPGVHATTSSTQQVGGLSSLVDARRVVEEKGACALPGVSIKYDTFMPEMWRAVQRGFVSHDHAAFVAEGLRYGFRCGVDVSKMVGHRWFQNYPTTFPHAAHVQGYTAISKRVAAYKTLDLGLWSNSVGDAMRGMFDSTAIFPVGLTDKRHEPGVMRLVDDHTRTGLNAAALLGMLAHTLNAVPEIAGFLKQGYFMHVSDVDGAFTVLPFHPDLWRYMFFRYNTPGVGGPPRLYVHITGDFGTKGMPGVFKIFFVDVLMNMARSAMILTLPCPVYVDDLSLIGPVMHDVIDEMARFQQWSAAVCGVFFKAIKDRMAAQQQVSLGFVWDSRTLTRSLEEYKLKAYVDVLTEFAARPKLSLKEMQSAAGKMQRAAYTLPPGAACLLSGLFLLMAGLRLPWHTRRTTKQVRSDFKWFSDILRANLGRGHYSFDLFKWALEVRSDACKGKGYTGGGFVSKCGRYDFWKYGSKAARQHIDFLEGDTVCVCLQKMGQYWYRCRVPFAIDNMTFEKSTEKGRSRAERLQVLLKEVFALQLEDQFVLCPFWLSSADNELADHLSREREQQFLVRAYETGFWHPEVVPIRLIGAGTTRTLPEQRGTLPSAVDPRLRMYSAPSEEVASLANGLPSGERLLFHHVMQMPGQPPVKTSGGGPHHLRQEASVSYPRASLTEGLPDDLHDLLGDVIDNRYADSSWRSIESGVKKWKEVAVRYGWDPVIKTDDPRRGGKLVAFVLVMTRDTDLTFSSIENYLWGMRTWQELHLQADPVKGVMAWELFMASVKVLTFVPHEPRVPTPMDVIEKIVASADKTNFEDVQMVTLILGLLYTYSRVECPCPQSFTGRGSWDDKKHWRVQDFDVGMAAERRAGFIRFRGIKQDRLEERPEAQGDGDWSVLGEIPGSDMCFVKWLILLNSFHGYREKSSPMFVSRDRTRPLLYSAVRKGFHEMQQRVGVASDRLTGLHGLRVQGYNRSKQAVGEALTVEHGRWMSSGHERYSRFSMADVARIAAGIAGVALPVVAAAVVPPEPEAGRAPQPPARRLQRAELRQPEQQPEPPPASPAPPAEPEGPAARVKARSRSRQRRSSPGSAPQ